MSKLFSVKKEGIRIIFNILGLKLKVGYTNKIDYPVEAALIESLKSQISDNTVLMLEANDFHGEIMPGYIKYLLDLGFNVDLLATEKHKEDSTLCRLKTDRVKTYYTNISTMEKILQNPEIMNKYRGMFVNSMCLFRKDRRIKSPALVYKYFKNIQKPAGGFCINVCHTVDKFKTDFLKKNNCVVLAKTKRSDIPIVNPCYFGEVKITDKNDKTIFLISGDGSKNFGMVADSVRKLLIEGITNFKVYVTGRNKHTELSEDLKSYVEFLGYVSFEKLYSLAEESDFIIPCLDPDNKKHLWYINNGTSGAFQLSYGFLKPMLIAEKFAQKAGVDSESAIIYEKNPDLMEAMRNAICMDKDNYKRIQTKLECIRDELYHHSLTNVKNIIVGNELQGKSLLLLRCACLGFLTFKNFDLSKFKIISFNKQRVDFILKKYDSPKVQMPLAELEKYVINEEIFKERWETQTADIFNQKNVKALILDSFSELADKLFYDTMSSGCLCALYSELNKNSGFDKRFKDGGIIDLDLLPELYRTFFKQIKETYGDIPIIYLIFPDKYETRTLYINRKIQIKKIVENLQKEFPTLHLYEPDFVEKNKDGLAYHFSDKTYKLFAEKLEKDIDFLQVDKKKNIFEYLIKYRTTINMKKQLILFSFIKITY